MKANTSISAPRLVLLLGVTTLSVACGRTIGSNTASAGSSSTSGRASGAGLGSTSTGVGGTSMAGANIGGSGTTGAECVEDSDCTVTTDCYTTSCQSGSCVQSPAERGSACATGVCRGVGVMVECVACVNDAGPGLEDSGCPAAAPVCDESASPPMCVRCQEAADCSDGIECTRDSCNDSACESVALPAASACSEGVCNGQPGVESCVRCIDDASVGVDSGCTTQQPLCDPQKLPATCAECLSAVDCDDNNECTSDSCQEGVCQPTTLLAGTPCNGGYCNGIIGRERCLVVACQSSPECDDSVTCTSEVCEGEQVCAYVTDDSQCPDSGDICAPNRCTVVTGCQQVDISRSVELLSNGDLDAGVVDWTMTSVNYNRIIFGQDYIPRLTAHSEPNVAWLGGGEAVPTEVNSLSQVVSIPAGTVRLELSFAYQIHAADLPDNHNHLQIYLRAASGNQTDQELTTFYNQDAWVDWTWLEFSTTVDATAWAGSDALLEFNGTGVDGYSHFFVDSVSLVATICE